MVPPEVKMTSPASQANSAASASRASSSTRRAARPVACRLEALPPGAASQAAVASGRTGVVAA